VNQIPARYRIGLLVAMAVAALFALLTLRERRRSVQAELGALSDSLTGLSNRQAFHQQLEREWKRSLRYGHELGLVLLDLDGFKQINDTQGHPAGDRVLREAAATISGRVRETDIPARLGGDEFVVICPETGRSGLDTLAQGLTEALESHSIRASIGFAQREPEDLLQADLIARADAAMYEAKRRGRESVLARGALAAA